MNTHDKYELPPLPSPFGIVDPDGAEGMMQYTTKDLQDYAKAYALSAIEADRQRRGEPVAFAKDGVLFWRGEHAAWRGLNGDLYLATKPADKECGCCGRSDRCDPDCDAAHPVEPVKVPSDTNNLAHEIWAAAQTAPGEGIGDAVDRIAALLTRYDQAAQPTNPPESPDSCDAQRWQKARTLPRSWWRDAFNRIAAEGVTLDELIDAETRRKLP